MEGRLRSPYGSGMPFGGGIAHGRSTGSQRRRSIQTDPTQSDLSSGCGCDRTPLLSAKSPDSPDSETGDEFNPDVGRDEQFPVFESSAREFAKRTAISSRSGSGQEIGAAPNLITTIPVAPPAIQDEPAAAPDAPGEPAPEQADQADQATNIKVAILRDAMASREIYFDCIHRRIHGVNADNGIFFQLMTYVNGLDGDYFTVRQLDHIETKFAELSAEINAYQGTGIDKASKQKEIQAIRHKLEPIRRKEKFETDLEQVHARLARYQTEELADITGELSSILDDLNKVHFIDAAGLANLSFRLDVIMSGLSTNRAAIAGEVLIDVNGKIAELQATAALAWELSARAPMHDANGAPISAACNKAYQTLIDNLRDMRTAVLELDDAESTAQITRLLSGLAEDMAQPDPRGLVKTADNLHTLVEALNRLRAKLNKSEIEAEVAAEADTRVDFLLAAVAQSQLTCAAIQHSVTAGEFAVAPFPVARLTALLDGAMSLVSGKGMFREKCSQAIAKLKVAVAGKETLDQHAWREIDTHFDALSVLLERYNDDYDVGNLRLCFVKNNVQCLRRMFNEMRSIPPDAAVPVELKSRQGFFNSLKTVKAALRGFDAEAHSLVQGALQRFIAIDDQPTLQDWAKTSLELEQALRILKADPLKANYLHSDRTLGSLRKALEHLEFVSRFAWAEQAHNSIVAAATTFYEATWNPAYSKSTTIAPSAGVLLGLPSVSKGAIGIDLGLERRSVEIIDDEGYFGKLKVWGGSLKASANFVVARAALKFSYLRGKYFEWKSPKQYTLHGFNSVVSEFSGSSIFSRWSSRFIAWLGIKQSPARPKIGEFLHRSEASAPRNIFGSKSEISEFENLRLKYEGQKKHLEQFFSVLANPPARKSPLAPVAMQGIVLARSITEKAIEPLKASATITSLNTSASLGLAGHSPSGADTTIDLGNSVGLTPSAGIEVPVQKMTLDVSHYKPLCEKFNEMGTTLRESDLIDRLKIKAALEKRSRGVLARLSRRRADGKNIKAGLWGENLAKIDDAITWAHRVRELALLTAQQRITLSQSDRNILRESERADLGATKRSALELVKNQQYLARGLVRPILEFLEKQRMLKQDFEHYNHLQCQLIYGDATAGASIDKFHAEYGARNKEEFLARVLMLNAQLYSETMDAPDQIDELTTLKDNALEFEKSVLAPVFSYKREKVDKLISFKENFELSTSDLHITLSLGVGLGSAVSSLVSAAANLSASVLLRIRKHVNIFRSGGYADVTVHIDAAVNSNNLVSTLELVAKGLKCNPKTAQFADAFSDWLTQTPPEQLPSMLNGRSRGVDLTVRFYQPEKFNLGPRALFAWATSSATFSANPKGMVPVAKGVTVTMGLTLDRSTTNLIKVSYSPRTLFCFAVHYLHELASENGNALDGSVPATSYWATILQEQKSALKRLFINVADEHHATLRNARLPGELLKEMDEIERVFLGNEPNPFEKTVFRRLKEDFIKAADTYAKSHKISTPFEEKDYQRAVKSFENLMLAYHPHLQRFKKDSPKTSKELLLHTT